MATSLFKEYFKGYEILGELGRGNARVLKARHLVTGELVAIKHFAFNTEPDALRRFQRESEIMKSIQHEHIVKIMEVHLDAELPYIVMQLIEGGDLRSLLKIHGTLDTPTVIRLAYQMTEALDAIHEKAVVHRDVKPENIMYRRLPDGQIQFLLTDFGIAKLREQCDTITVTGASMLTYDYASPEQFNQSKTVSTPTDYYSLGVVLYECLTGKVPFEFEQDDLLMHINRVISCPLPIPQMPGDACMPPSLLQLLEGLTAKQSAFRLCDPVNVRNLLRLAAIEEIRGLNALTPVIIRKQTTKNSSLGAPIQMEETTISLVPLAAPVVRSKGRELTSTAGILLLVGVAIFFSWRSVVKSNEPQPETIPTRTIKPLVMEVKHTSPVSGPISIVPAKYTPATLPMPDNTIVADHTAVNNNSITGSAATGTTDAGVPLINGIYYDDFSDQKDSLWNPSRDANSEYKLADGKYIMKGLADSLSYSASLKFNMDIDKDFRITANTMHVGDSTSDPFGINFCGDEGQDSYFVFYITASGFYSIGSSVKGEWHVLVDWTESSNIRKDANMNILAIEKSGNTIRFLINDNLETVLPFTGGFGNYFGLRVDGAQTVAFDQFFVKGNQ